MCADLNTAKVEIFHAALQFPDCQIGILHRQCANADKTVGKFSDAFGQIVIQKPRYIEGIIRLGPVAEHDRNSREYLNLYVLRIAFFHSLCRIPAVALDFAEELSIIAQHASPARLVMIEGNEPTVAEFLFPAWQILWQDMGVNGDSLQRHSSLPLASEAVSYRSSRPTLSLQSN